MNVKRIFGEILTVFGIWGLIYTAVLFATMSNGTHVIKGEISYSVLCLIFFISGIKLIRTTKDEL